MLEPEEGYLPQGLDYLGFLNSELRGLQGFGALANELVQNADDAKAKWINFDITDDALVVENSSVFSECTEALAAECPWKTDESRGYRCDLHSFRQVAGGNKRLRGETIGAFGIGFISVYQITDRPEMLCRRRHWLINPLEAQEYRIHWTKIEEVPITRFRLPWANDPNSPLRKALQVQAVAPNVTETMASELERALPRTIMFLRNVEQIRLLRNRSLVKTIDRKLQDDRLEIQVGEYASTWHLIRGSFESDAKRLEDESGIRHDRSPEFAIALPEAEMDLDGRLFAFLPTQHRIGLPLHLHADFFPSSDRKRVLFDDDYQGRWNRAAIKAAARALGARLEALTDVLGHESFWNLISTVKYRYSGRNDGSPDTVFDPLWECIKGQLSRSRVVFSSQGEWTIPAESRLLTAYGNEVEALPILEELGLRIVHEDLKSHYTLLHSEDVRVPIINSADLVTALNKSSESCQWACSAPNHPILDRQIERLLNPLTGTRLQKARQDIGNCAIGYSCDNTLIRPLKSFRADAETIRVFTALQLGNHFLQPDTPQTIADLAPMLTIGETICLLESVTPDVYRQFWNKDHRYIIDLVRWLKEQAGLSDPQIQKRIRALVIWPSEGELKNLDELVVPGTFIDELGLSSIVDLNALEIDGKFLLGLDAKELTVVTYAREQVKRAFEANREVTSADRRKLVRLFAERFSEIGDDHQVRKALSGCPIVECCDGEFRLAEEVYFENEGLKELLGEHISIAKEPSHSRNAIEHFLDWLGVSREPRLKDLLERVLSLANQPPNGDTRIAMQKLFIYLAKRWDRDSVNSVSLETLKSLKWLPATGDLQEWHEPGLLYSVFEKHLFYTQAKFLDIPQQRELSKFLDYLGVKSTPTASQMINHLLAVAQKNEPITRDFYIRLNAHASDPNILRLKGQQCLLLNDRSYVRPDQVFWEEHGFGRYRFRLSGEMRTYEELLNELDVKETPRVEDAKKVLKEISAEFSATNSPLDAEAKSVVLHCWKILLSASEDDLRQLRDFKVIPDSRDILEPSQYVFFDDRPGLAQRFGNSLKHNVIARPQDAWRGMQRGGVRPLSEAATTRLIERQNPTEDPLLAKLVNERRGILTRVIEAHREAGDTDWDLSCLGEMRFERVEKLSVSHSLKLGNRLLNTPHFDVSAYYDPVDKILYFNGDEYPWAAISRELSYALNPQAEAGKIAPGLKEVLSARSMIQATESLDELGYATLDIIVDDEVSAAGPVEFGGTEPDEPELETGTQVGEVSGTVVEFQNPTPNAPCPAEQAPIPTTESKTLTSLVESEQAATSATNTTSFPHKSTSSRFARSLSKKHEATRRRKRGRLYSYVLPPNSVTDSVPDTTSAQLRTEIDEAGIKKVMQHERDAGRDPDEMPHHNEGFDIKSYDNDGKLVRYIEVKSVSTDWDVDNVKMTQMQFEHATEIGDRYWLYIVERAQSDDYEIHRVQDPARLVDYFVFDPGWEALDELVEMSVSTTDDLNTITETVS